MPYAIEIRDPAPRPFAAVQDRANDRNIGEKITGRLGEVYGFLKDTEIAHLGINVVVYRNESGENDFHTDEGVPIDIGVLVADPFTNGDKVLCLETPSGAAVTTTHKGPYEQLAEAHGALRAWCEQAGHQFAGPCWEIYGHWTDNPDALETEIFYLIK